MSAVAGELPGVTVVGRRAGNGLGAPLFMLVKGPRAVDNWAAAEAILRHLSEAGHGVVLVDADYPDAPVLFRRMDAADHVLVVGDDDRLINSYWRCLGSATQPVRVLHILGRRPTPNSH